MAMEITDEDFAALKIEIERAIMVLANLQRLHRKYCGQDHIMPIYLAVPKHLKDVV